VLHGHRLRTLFVVSRRRDGPGMTSILGLSTVLSSVRCLPLLLTVVLTSIVVIRQGTCISFGFRYQYHIVTVPKSV
jgi:hypothetical protein